mmetsp:Transcript_9463/g.21645  ORF Transcript_9463/g.21645 Transcript_9463/m.21645 type:complete len:226 (+) Transcript_9463:993-1670(+)
MRSRNGCPRLCQRFRWEPSQRACCWARKCCCWSLARQRSSCSQPAARAWRVQTDGSSVPEPLPGQVALPSRPLVRPESPLGVRVPQPQALAPGPPWPAAGPPWPARVARAWQRLLTQLLVLQGRIAQGGSGLFRPRLLACYHWLHFGCHLQLGPAAALGGSWQRKRHLADPWSSLVPSFRSRGGATQQQDTHRCRCETSKTFEYHPCPGFPSHNLVRSPSVLAGR